MSYVFHQHIGIAIPAHNEAESIKACLDAIKVAIQKLNLAFSQQSITIEILVVLDSCTDETLKIVQEANIDYLTCELRCVGQVRELGIQEMIKRGVTWIACTDADTVVSEDWLIEQLNHQPTAMVCGVVSVDNWEHLSLSTRHQYIDHYQDKMGHQHIHGANLSFSSEAYLAVGGFAPIKCHEDVDLVKRFQAHNFPITWSNKVRVTTSSRLDARADEGFAHFLRNLELTHNE